MMQATAAADLDSHERLIETLESQGRLDRVVEGLPSAESFRKLRELGLGLTRPELAVIMAYAKLDLFSSIVASKAPDDPAFEPMLIRYFPDELAKYAEARKHHRLRREIIATMLSNRIVNLTGPTFAVQKRDAEGIDAGHVAQAFEAAFSAFHIDDLIDRISALDGKAPAEAQTLMMVETSANLRMLAGGFLSDPDLVRTGSITRTVDRSHDAIADVRALLPSALSPLVLGRVEARAEQYRAAGAPADVAHDVALVRALASARETVEIMHHLGASSRQITAVFLRDVLREAAFGAVVGALLGAGAVWLLGQQFAALDSGMTSGGGLMWPDWLVIAAIPLAGVLLALVTSRITIALALRDML
jgi:glutamate dehydrogenase